MKRRYLFYLFIACALLFNPGCSGGGDGSSDRLPDVTNNDIPNEPADEPADEPEDPLSDPCSIPSQNKFVYEVMTETYLWYDQVPQVDYAQFESPETLLNALMYKELDRWSYITSKDGFYALFEEGKYVGQGFRLKYDREGNVRICFVYENSPAALQGLVRGDKILAISGKTIDEIEANQFGALFWVKINPELPTL